MMKKAANKKFIICSRGHRFYKSSSCPVCPKCWPSYRKKLQSDFPEKMPAPALRALHTAKIKKLSDLQKYSQVEISSLHGMGPKALEILSSGMKPREITFKKVKKQLVTGKRILYHKDGSVWAKGKVIHGKPDGYWEWYRRSGVIVRSGYFKDGKNVGEWITYDKSGKVYKVTALKQQK